MATLPGVRTTILDRFYNLARTDLPGGPLIAVIAKRSTATTSAAPDFIPYFATSEQDVITQFGENSPIHRAYYEVTTGGGGGIVLVPLPSDTVFNHVTGGLTSASNTALGDIFDEAFAAVESARADIVVPWGRGSNTFDWDDYATPVATPGGNTEYAFHADNSASAGASWLKKVADKCAEITANSYPITAVMGMKPLAGPENPTPSQITTGTSYAALVDRESITNGSFVSIVATEIRPLSAPTSWGWSNGAALYASLIARLNSWSATTGKPLYNVDRVRWNPTRTQAEVLVTKGLVPVQLDYQGAPRWIDGTTFAKAASDFVRLTTVRIVFDAVKLIRKVSQNYVGEGMSIANRNSFETQISSSLRNMQQVGAINHADFRVQYSPSTNTAYIDLAVVPAFELREIIVTVSVNF
jgi:hypothetical protein